MSKASPSYTTRGPLCVYCGMGRCRRRFGTKPQKCGRRIVEGKAWNWYCSSLCQAKAMGLKNGQHPRIQAAAKANTLKAQQKLLQRLIAACKAEMTAEGLVPVRSMVRFMWHELRKEYAKGCVAQSYRERQKFMRPGRVA